MHFNYQDRLYNVRVHSEREEGISTNHMCIMRTPGFCPALTSNTSMGIKSGHIVDLSVEGS